MDLTCCFPSFHRSRSDPRHEHPLAPCRLMLKEFQKSYQLLRKAQKTFLLGIMGYMRVRPVSEPNTTVSDT
uniref:Uncharacterized protein n=1 Tax=Rhizobium loti TaxID=381 RepID=Q8KGQ3_RHILI|nr:HYPOTHETICAL PROTEIN [Mesorhizobium japonicum R7A]